MTHPFDVGVDYILRGCKTPHYHLVVEPFAYSANWLQVVQFLTFLPLGEAQLLRVVQRRVNSRSAINRVPFKRFHLKVVVKTSTHIALQCCTGSNAS
jgi:hypothetical protein